MQMQLTGSVLLARVCQFLHNWYDTPKIAYHNLKLKGPQTPATMSDTLTVAGMCAALSIIGTIWWASSGSDTTAGTAAGTAAPGALGSELVHTGAHKEKGSEQPQVAAGVHTSGAAGLSQQKAV